MLMFEHVNQGPAFLEAMLVMATEKRGAAIRAISGSPSWPMPLSCLHVEPTLDAVQGPGGCHNERQFSCLCLKKILIAPFYQGLAG